MLWEWRHRADSPSQLGKFLTCCLGAAAIVWDKYWMVQLTRMLCSELLFFLPSCKGTLPGKQHKDPPGLWTLSGFLSSPGLD